ncbi:MAG: flagellar basal body-associated protein FliL [Heyndrickxia faecalis]|jgi:flagellar FliL protein|uniref:Flagellar protein FliL n=2 Tax=Heyndrickxia TaxID=2837504 RepID=G2TJK1_HEYCO|nr:MULTISPECIES: flagellar basal body-associated protein FliL [Heyndrickxia]AEO99272.1 flagellar basal body-associated protein FliL [Heyndrickxia coagulans 36D1]APB35897.1 flagellar basal body-associated protein FliL [Heyndrickxia coagulans]AVD55858.1 flagellar basal body-associated protein FliL [Heyndrickxia coagulans]AWP36753.1 flagellar basal body-associated protein FliL [Heyndrickxia coagulans]KGT39640.1 flagellar basal body-associated protein FliL [Heyndrickxia coagulans P38]
MNKMVRIMLVMISVILLAGIITIIVIYKSNEATKAKGPNIDEVVDSSVDIDTMTTNLKDNHIVQIAIKIEGNNKKAKDELTKRDFQIKDIMIDELSNMNMQDLQAEKGKQKFKTDIKNRLNKMMQDGEVVNVYITSFVIQ